MSTVPTSPRATRGPSLAPAHRAGHVERRGSVTRLRCECAAPSCRETFPAVAESSRGTAGRYIVVPAHLGDAVVVRASDRFFVVETDRSAGRFPAPAERPLRLAVVPDPMLESTAG